MEFNIKSKIFLFSFWLAIFTSLAFLYFLNPIKGYNDTTTHPAITDEIVDFYNLFYDQKLTDEEKEWIIQGAIDEDTYPRWMNHYFDPIHNEGWDGEGTGFIPSSLVEGGARVFFVDKDPASSLEWMRNRELQSQYSSYGGNRTWDRAIYEMAVNNNKEEAYYTLGFVLHLMEDATVPDHTRNDSHAPIAGVDEGSPYEAYTNRFTRQSWNGIARDLKNGGFKPVKKDTPEDYMRGLALYSNKNFFSKDTIFIDKFNEPKIIREDSDFGYGVDDFNVEFKLVFMDKHWNAQNYKYVYIYRLGNSDEYEVLDNYFTLLSRQAVLNGAGIIDLFHREVEKARQNPESLTPPPVIKPSKVAVSLMGETAKYGWRGVPVFLAKTGFKNFVLRPTDLFVSPIANLSAGIINAVKEIQTGKIIDNMGTGFVGTQINTDNDQIDTDNDEEQTDTESYRGSTAIELTDEVAALPLPNTETPRNDVKEEEEVSAVPRIDLRESALVKWIIDGDTFVLNDNTKVRLIGIDTPERDDCFYNESKAMLMDLVLDKEVRLEKDISDIDRYGRLLRYVYVNDIFINDYMVREGYAEAWQYGSDVRFSEQFSESQNYAQENELGLWSACLNNEIASSHPAPRNDNRGGVGSVDKVIASIGNNNPSQETSSQSPPPQGGERGAKPDSEPEPEPELELEPEPEPEPEDNIPPDPPVITTNNGEDFLATATPVILSGTMSDDTGIILINSSSDNITLYDASWDSQLILSEGENFFSVTAQDLAQNESSPDTITITLDSTGPASEINIINYNMMNRSFNVSWGATEEDVATSTYEPQYRIGQNNDWQNLTIENGGEFEAVQDKTTYYFRVRASDIKGNQGPWSEIAEAEINTKPIVFNEIAWMGTEAVQKEGTCDGAAYDEWIELFNTSESDVNLSGWHIKAGDGNPDIVIFDASADSFIISAGGYFLLERGDDDNVSNVAADFVYPVSLCYEDMMENRGELLYLKDNTGHLINQVGSWYAGNNTIKRTMERVRTDVGSDTYNWLDYTGEGSSALDTDGNPILGTPKAENSVHNQYYSVTGNISHDTVFYKHNDPYLIHGNLYIEKGKTLTVESGVNVLMDGNAGIEVAGTLRSLGLATDRVAFNSTAASPEFGDWNKIYFAPTSQNSELNFTDILYGGQWNYGRSSQSVAIEVATADVSFNNILVKESAKRGIWLKNSNSVVINSTFENINYKSNHAMIEVDGGNPQITNSVFQNSNGNRSQYGIRMQGKSMPSISNNIFSDTNYPVVMFDADPVFSENVATGNLHNNIYLYGNNHQIDVDTILEKDLPYLIDSILYVINGATLTINPGVEIQINYYGGYGDGIVINDGALKAVGTANEKIKFTTGSGTPWKWIYFTEEAGGDSEIKYAIVENGGAGSYPEGAMIKIEGMDIALDNVEIRNSQNRGVLLRNSDSIITNSWFECNASSFDACGGGGFTHVPALDIQNSDPTISNTTFNLNRLGIKSAGTSTPVFSNITFGTGDKANFINTDPLGLIP